MGLVFYIFPNDIRSYFVTNTPDKVTVIPQFTSPKLFPQLGKLFEYLSSRYSLHYLYNFRWRIFWWRLGKYVYMVFNDFHRTYSESIFISYFCKCLFQIDRYVFTQYMLPVFRYPYQLILQVIDSMFGPFYTHADFIAGLFNFRNSTLLTSRRGCFHPASKLAGIQQTFSIKVQI